MPDPSGQDKPNGAADGGALLSSGNPVVAGAKKKSRSSRDAAAIKRRCVSTACIACRRRKSKCDGNTPSCAACSSVYGTECVYDPNSDHRRKGVYKEKIDSLKTRNSTLQTLVQAILNATEDEVPALVRQIRTCESLDDVAEAIIKQEQGIEDEEDEDDLMLAAYTAEPSTFETELAGKMGELRLENGSVRFIGGTSNLIYLAPTDEEATNGPGSEIVQQQDEPLLSWTNVTSDSEVVIHLINMYFTWHYPYFTTLSKSLFYRDFLLGKPPGTPKRTVYCSSLLVNAMLALGCHFTNSPAGCADPNDPTTKGDAFFQEAKRLIVENDEYEKPRLTTIQALALMSVREAGCGREAKGWVYSGMSFRMAQDMGLNLDSGGMAANKETMDEQDIDARRVTFWGCFLFDKCWSNYLGRLPQLPVSNITVPKYDVFPDEDSAIWSAYTDNGLNQMHSQPSRTRAIALQISSLCEISSDLLIFFYHPQALERSMGKSAELKKLSELHTRLEAWRKDLPKEFEPKEGQLPNVLLMHMFFNLLYIHLFRPFLKYSPTTSPLPAHVSPRKLCSHAASMISKLMRLYKRTYNTVNSNAPVRTPRAPAQEDHIANEIRNIRALTETQSSLLGGDNTPLYEGAGSTGFDGVTPRRQQMETPNPMATPFRQGMNGVGATPLHTPGPGATPMRTPRDSFAINTDGEMQLVGGTPRDRKLRDMSIKHKLKQSLASLPKPKDTEWELELPEEQQELSGNKELSEEDAEIRDRRNRQIREAQELLESKRRTQVLQKRLPRPAVVDITALLKKASDISDPVEAAIEQEMALLIANDALKYPAPNMKVQGNSRPLETFDDDSLARARLQLVMEVPRDGSAEGDDIFEKAWKEVHNNSLLPGLAGYGEDDEIDEHQLMTEAFDNVQDSIVTAAEKGNKLEKKLALHLGGYQKRAKMLRQKIADAADALEKATFSLDSFRTLQIAEEAAISSRLEGLRAEVGFISRREREAQEIFRTRKGELDGLTGGTNGYH